MSPDVDRYLKQTRPWRAEIVSLRAVLLGAKLDEALKWGKPCYLHAGASIAIIQPFKRCLGLMFFKGALLTDVKGLLVDNGPNSQAARRLEFTSVAEIDQRAAAIRAYIRQAVALEKAGEKVAFKRRPEALPVELTAKFRRQPKLKQAFLALTPGRQRAYILHFAGAKQSATRTARIERCAPRILAGKGLNDR